MAEAVEKAYLAIRGGIVAGAHPGGTHLRAADLAESLGLSRTPVREALRRLHAEGLVEFRPNHGAYVCDWTLADLNEVFALRARLEGYAAELAARSLTESGIMELSRLAAAMSELARERPEGFLDMLTEMNSQFHRGIVAAAANRRLAAMIATVVEAQLVVRTFSFYSDADMDRSMAHHHELVAAFRARDGRWAAAVMTSHVAAAHHAYLSSLRAEPLTPQAGPGTARLSPASPEPAGRAALPATRPPRSARID
jgi:DNA-binding GntR family transcriptional regulator